MLEKPDLPKVTVWDYLAILLLLAALGFGGWYFCIYLPAFAMV